MRVLIKSQRFITYNEKKKNFNKNRKWGKKRGTMDGNLTKNKRNKNNTHNCLLSL